MIRARKRDLTADLEWDIPDIKTLLKHRISKSIGGERPNFNETWYTIFNNESVPYSGGRKSLRSFDFITRSTQGRPRDFIHYLQVCAANQLSKGPSRIDKVTIREADKAYSNYLKSELVDEIHGLLPDINEILGIFTQIRKWNFQIGEFRDMHRRYFDAGTVKTKDADFILRTLFYFSVIGNVSRGGYHVFRHENPDAVMNFHENIVIHRGLMKSLQIF